MKMSKKLKDQIRQCLEDLRENPSPRYPWRRSAKGNLYRRLPHDRVAIVYRSRNGYRLQIKPRNDTTLSQRLYSTQEKAMDAGDKYARRSPCKR